MALTTLTITVIIQSHNVQRALSIWWAGMRDLVNLLPMLDELCVLGLTGSQLHAALENGVSQYPKLEVSPSV